MLLPGCQRDIGVNQVGFYFRNAGPIASAVTEIYFDDGALGSGPTIYDNPLPGNSGVDFVAGANPSNLPGHNNITPSFNADTAFNSQAGSPQGLNKKGIDIGQSLLLTFSTNADVLAALESGALRIGLHVGSIGPASGSDSYVNSPTPVPLPGALLLLGVGLVRLVSYGRRKQVAA